MGPPSNVFFQLVLISLMVTLIAYRRCRFWQKKSSFQIKLIHFDLGGYVNMQNSRIWGTENPHAYIEKPTHPKRVTVWCGFWSRGIIGPFFFENEQGEAVTVNGDRCRTIFKEFFSQKLKRRILSTFGYNRTALHATQPLFCALFLKIALSAAELMSFGHFGAVIWHRWTIICGVRSSLRQLTP